MVEDEDEAEGENSHHVDGEGQQEEEEVAVVPPADAVVDPGAVVVKVLRVESQTQLLKQPFRFSRVSKFGVNTHLHAVVTDTAVGAARRPVEVTGGAPLHPDLNALDLHILVERRSEIIVLVLVLIRYGGGENRHSKANQRGMNIFEVVMGLK